MAETREITLEIDSVIDDELNELARTTGRDKTSLAREALIEWLEDQEDLRLIKARIAENNPTLSFDDMMKRLDLED
jgi:RHH-type rel operon transcriptional repressor/antitoxin RelB